MSAWWCLPTVHPVTRADIPDDGWVLLGDIQRLFGVSKSRAYALSRDRTFPEPVVDRPEIRVWRRDDVEAWGDRYRQGWRD